MDAFFIIKIIELLLEPLNLSLIFLAIGFLLVYFGRWQKAGHSTIAVTCATLIMCSTLPLGQLLSIPLERRFVASPSISNLDGIVVLGGEIDPRTRVGGGCSVAGQYGTRLAAAAVLGRRFDHARIHLTGGIGSILGGSEPEAEEMRRCLVESGISPGRITTEIGSRATFENAEMSKAIVQPRVGENWALITSALHMPRAVGAFRHVGWPVIPYPVEAGPYTWSFTDWSANLSALEWALHEWTGLIWYRVSGKSDDVFPGSDGYRCVGSDVTP